MEQSKSEEHLIKEIIKKNMEYDIYPIELIKTSIRCVKFLKQKPTIRDMRDDVIRSLILYCLIRNDNSWFPVNRNYKPIGIHATNWVDYEKYPCLLIPNERINFENVEIEWSTLNSKDTIYIFKDSTFPRTAKTIQRYCDVINKMFFKIQI
ncbi:MAG TPA: hypothetical protein VMX17_09460 [Candidatus Glassbacteria bacterium]|nr:hypothetical protein [Candidatus Glassbacteria bacterium]